MSSQEKFLAGELSVSAQPFPHFNIPEAFDRHTADKILSWFKECKHWSYTETSFYTQYEFSLLDLQVPEELTYITSDELTSRATQILKEKFGVERFELVGITAHKLIDGYRMGVHNDLLGREESHRLVIQFNDGWEEDNGGFLMLFNSKDPNDVASLIVPLHNSGIGFEISEKSYHAVSTVHGFDRYTLVYTFNRIHSDEAL